MAGVERDPVTGQPAGSFLSDDTHFPAVGVAFDSLSDDDFVTLYQGLAEYVAARGVTTMHCLDGQFVPADRDVSILHAMADQLPVHTVLMFQTRDVEKALSMGLPQ